MGDKKPKKMLHTTHSELFELGGNQYRQAIHARRIAHDEFGSLVRNLDDYAVGDVNFPNVVEHSSMLLYVAPDGKRRICPTRDPLKYIEVGSLYIKPAATWTKVTLNPFSRSANLLTSVNTNVNVSVRMAGHYCKLEAELKNGYVPPNNQVAFPVSLNGLTWDAGTIRDNGAAVANLRAPYVYDAANPETTRPISWQFVNVSGQTYLLLTLPGLAGMARPVVDPTLVLQPAAADGIDTWIDSANPTTNHATSTQLYAEDAGAGRKLRTLMKFDLTGLVGTTISSATLAFANSHTSCPDGTVYRILTANGAWAEAGATWNHAVGTTDWAGGHTGCGTLGTDYAATPLGTYAPNGATWSMSFDVAQFALLVANNYGMIFIETTEGDYLNHGQYGLGASSDHATAAYRPTLTITYTLPTSIGMSRIFIPDWGIHVRG